MRKRDWFNLSFISLLIALYCPTILVFASSEVSEWSLVRYEIEYPNQFVTWVVISAVFMLSVLVGSRLIPFLDTVKAFLVIWVAGGILMNVTQAEMFYVTLRAFGQSFPQSDVWLSILNTKQSLWNMIGLGLLVAVVAAKYSEKIIEDGGSYWLHGSPDDSDDSSFNPSSKEEELEQLIQIISERPPISY